MGDTCIDVLEVTGSVCYPYLTQQIGLWLAVSSPSCAPYRYSL